MEPISILGSGWLGLPLAKHLISLGHPVKASTRREGRLPEVASIGAAPFIVNISDGGSTGGSGGSDLPPTQSRDFLSSPILIINIPSKDIEGFRRLVSEVEGGAEGTDMEDSRVKKVLFVSSTSVYEESNKTIREADGEETDGNPLIKIENLFKGSDRFETTVVRFGGLIGYTRNPGRFFTGRVITEGESYVNMIHRDDCINIISAIIEKGVWSETFNCCADTHPTKREFYSHAARSAGEPAPEFADSEDSPFKIISNEKVKNLLNYDFVYPDLMKINFGGA